MATKIKRTRIKQEDNPHYIPKKDFNESITTWINENKNKKSRKDWSEMPSFVAECFMKIAEHYALKGNWRGYTYIDEMKAEARLNCIKYAHNYNPERGDAFSYFTQYVHNSFLQVLASEKKQASLKYHSINEESSYSLDKINLYDEEQATVSVDCDDDDNL